MKRNEEIMQHRPGQESGAALVTVLLITFLLVTASIAMLTAAGASARNSTDVLSETKAYYAAESGIQAAVNALRFGDAGGPVNYREAVNYFANSGTLGGTAWGLPYDDTCSGQSRVRIAGDCENSYSISVRDPDNSQTSLSFRTSGAVFRPVGTTAWSGSRVFTGADSRTTTLTWQPNNPNPTSLTFSADIPNVSTQVGSFKLTNGISGGTPMTSDTEFRVFYELMLPGNPGWVISGKITAAGAITVLSPRYFVTGSEIRVCGNVQNCGQIQVPTAAAEELATQLPAQIWPKEPHRLLVTSTGFGPNGSMKVLEAVLQKSPLDGANSVSPFTMLGGCFSATSFDAGRSNTTTYTGTSSGGVQVPAFAFTASCNLDTANAHIARHLTPSGQDQPPQVYPPPAEFDVMQLPEWQRSPQQLNSKIQIYRAQAQYTGTYYNPHPGPKINNPGYVAGQTGPMTGVTFCEGDCTVDGDLGGGILVVTGKLRSLGGFGFKGLILVTGSGGWERQGGGCGSIIGNVVIAPYTVSDLGPNVFSLPPIYEITGAGCSGIQYAGLDDLFEGENSALTNFIRGVAEK